MPRWLIALLMLPLLGACATTPRLGSGGPAPQRGRAEGADPRDRSVSAAAPGAITPPGPPSSGPGSADYPHGAAQVRELGSGNLRYWVYTPAEPIPETTPVLVYLHGYAALDPRLYDALLTHLARKGYTIVFPYYGGLLGTAGYEANAGAAVRDAFHALESGPFPRPDGRVGYAGHSIGGLLALRLAATAREIGTPQPQVIVLHEPAGVAILSFPLEPADLAAIPDSTHLLVILAQTSAGDRNSFALGAFENTESIPREHKNLLLVRSDAHGKPALASNHLGVQVGRGRPLDAIDWWGYVRPTEAALAEVLGVGPAPAGSTFCNTSSPACDWIRDAGNWSDGQPVLPTLNAGDLGL